MSSELIKAMEWLTWQLGMMYKVEEHNSTSFEVYGSEGQCTVEYNRHKEQVVVSLSYYSETSEDVGIDEQEGWDIRIDEENEDLLMSEMESILRWIRREM